MERGVVINGVKWEPRDGANYYCDYGKVYRDACSGMAADALGLYREMLLNDLWFFLHFGLGCGWANHPFIVERCFEVQFGPRTNTLDLWAREHGKTFVLTIAESLQETLRAYVLDLRDETTAIFCYNLKLSQKILNTMKRIFEDNEFLKVCFPDVLYTQPQTESPSWSEDKGLMLKRHSSALKEATFEAHGLIESLPTGPHFGRRVYDDVETEKVAASSDLSQKVKDNFDLSENLGVDGGTQRVLGTYYRHDGPLMYIRDKTDPENGEPIFHTRVYPATEDGSFFGKPVYLSPQRMRILRSNRFTYNCQQLLNPMPQEEQELRAEMLKEVDVRLIPSHLYKFMLVDPAGRKKKKKSDRWAIGLFGVNPFLDDVGCSDVYILDLFIKQCDMSEALTKFVDMYSRAGRVLRIGVERVALATTEVHIANALAARGIYVSTDTETIQLLTTQGREKEYRIRSNVRWPLHNGKIHVSSSVEEEHVQELKNEMDKFDRVDWHDDGLDILAYLYDMIATYRFPRSHIQESTDPKSRSDAWEQMFDEALAMQQNVNWMTA